MTIDRLKEIHQIRPFRSFVMHISDGASIRVSHPESIAYSTSGRTVVLIRPDDSTQFIDLLHVTRIELGNGVRGRRRSEG